MVVTVRLFGDMCRYHPDPGASQNDLEIVFDTGVTVRTVVEKLGVPDKVPRTVLVNRINAAMDQKLEDHDVVSVLQPLSGG